MKYLCVILSMFLLIVPLPGKASSKTYLAETSGSIYFNLDMPEYNLVKTADGQTRVKMENTGYGDLIGYPRLPCPIYTFALPPATRIKNAEITCTRTPLMGKYRIEANPPPFAEGSGYELNSRLVELYQINKERVYSGLEPVDCSAGNVIAFEQRREYSLVTVKVNPFSYDPLTGKLSATERINICISYVPVEPANTDLVEDFMQAGTIHDDVPECIHNKDQARLWYQPERRLRANSGMIILTTEELRTTTGSYIQWRESTGFDVTVVTREEIEASTEGADVCQKIRNWLRQNSANNHYLFIIGSHEDIPMRIITPFNNNAPSGFWDDPDLTPNPSDVYYGDLSAPDSESWDSDEDGYYGETFSPFGMFTPQDAPDIQMEMYVGRICSSNSNNIPGILENTWLFEHDEDNTYKETSVLAGGVFTFPAENGTTNPGRFGWTVIEYILNHNVLAPARATTLYEKEGSYVSPYDCDYPLTQDDLVSVLSSVDAGIFFERNHGNAGRFTRKVWFDDGDGVPEEDADVEWPVGLVSGDAFKLMGSKPNVAFLGSCLNGYPESANPLAQALLNFASVGVLAHTRVSFGSSGWNDPTDGGNNSLFFYILDNYVNQTTHDYVLGDALAAGRVQFRSISSSTAGYLNSYNINLFGDPALRHFGREGTLPSGVSEDLPEGLSFDLTLSVGYDISFQLPSDGFIILEVWDVSGRKVSSLIQKKLPAGQHSVDWDTGDIPSGSYFITLRTDSQILRTKAVVVR